MSRLVIAWFAARSHGDVGSLDVLPQILSCSGIAFLFLLYTLYILGSTLIPLPSTASTNPDLEATDLRVVIVVLWRLNEGWLPFSFHQKSVIPKKSKDTAKEVRSFKDAVRVCYQRSNQSGGAAVQKYSTSPFPKIQSRGAAI